MDETLYTNQPIISKKNSNNFSKKHTTVATYLATILSKNEMENRKRISERKCDIIFWKEFIIDRRSLSFP